MKKYILHKLRALQYYAAYIPSQLKLRNSKRLRCGVPGAFGGKKNKRHPIRYTADE